MKETQEEKMMAWWIFCVVVGLVITAAIWTLVEIDTNDIMAQTEIVLARLYASLGLGVLVKLLGFSITSLALVGAVAKFWGRWEVFKRSTWSGMFAGLAFGCLVGIVYVRDVGGIPLGAVLGVAAGSLLALWAALMAVPFSPGQKKLSYSL